MRKGITAFLMIMVGLGAGLVSFSALQQEDPSIFLLLTGFVLIIAGLFGFVIHEELKEEKND
jgi:hypothetical protein